MMLPNISHTWLGGIPQRNGSNSTANITGNILWWPEHVRYRTLRESKFETYGFMAWVRIPDRSPPNSMNAFFFEFGYTAPVMINRRTALVIPAPKVKSLLNAAV